MTQRTYQLVALLIVTYLVLSANISGLDVYALDEARNAGCAHEMMQRGDWIVPTFNYELRVEKPPIHYYFMIVSYYIFGFGEFGARFFSVIFGVLTVWVTYLFAERYLSTRAAWFAALSLTASLHYAIQFHMAVPDPYLIFFIAAGAFCFFRGWLERQTGFLILAYFFAGLGYLAKGPIAILLPGLGIFLFLILSGHFAWKSILRARPFLGLLIMILVVIPWHIAVGLATDGEWLRGFYITHNVERFTRPMEGHGGIFLLTWGYVIVGMLPLVVYLPQALRLAWVQRREQQGALLFTLLMAGGIVGFFSISSTKLPNYTVPAYPFLAVLLGHFIQTINLKEKNKRWFLVSAYVYLLLMLLVPVAAYLGLKFDPALSHLSYLGFYLVALPVGAIFALIFIYQRRWESAVYSQIISFILTILIFFWLAFPKIDEENPLHIALPKMDRELPVVSYGFFNPAFVFYLEREIKSYSSVDDLKKALQNYEAAYIVGRAKRMKELEEENFELIVKQRDIFEIPTTVVLKYEKGK